MARYALPVVALIVAPLAFSQESTLEEVVVASSFTHQVQGQNESSVTVIPGTDITAKCSPFIKSSMVEGVRVTKPKFTEPDRESVRLLPIVTTPLTD